MVHEPSYGTKSLIRDRRVPKPSAQYFYQDLMARIEGLPSEAVFLLMLTESYSESLKMPADAASYSMRYTAMLVWLYGWDVDAMIASANP